MPSSYNSRKRKERSSLAQRISQRITNTGFEILSYSRCKAAGHTCMVSSAESRRYADYVRLGKSCDIEAPSSAQWETLEKAKNKLEAITEAAEMEFVTVSAVAAEISARLARLRRQRKLLKRRGAEILRRGVSSLDELEALEEQEADANRVVESPAVPSGSQLSFPQLFDQILPDFSNPLF